MSKYLLIIALIILTNKIIIGQKDIIDTIVFQNAKVYTIDTISNESKEQAKSKTLFIVPIADMNENTFFLLNDSIHPIFSFGELEQKLDKKKRYKTHTSETDMAAYLNRKKLNGYIKSEIIDKDRKLIFIIENY
jgi:hypothetical protein